MKWPWFWSKTHNPVLKSAQIKFRNKKYLFVSYPFHFRKPKSIEITSITSFSLVFSHQLIATSTTLFSLVSSTLFYLVIYSLFCSLMCRFLFYVFNYHVTAAGSSKLNVDHVFLSSSLVSISFLSPLLLQIYISFLASFSVS